MRCQRRSLTPPVDEDEKNEESRRLEAHARKELEDAGCPPCYPPDVDITTRNVPQKFQAIVDYWLASLRTDDVVLCAQVRIIGNSWRTSYRPGAAFETNASTNLRMRFVSVGEDMVCVAMSTCCRARGNTLSCRIGLSFKTTILKNLSGWKRNRTSHDRSWMTRGSWLPTEAPQLLNAQKP